MYCIKCSKVIPDNSIFCSFCGTRVKTPKWDSNAIIEAWKDCIKKHLKSPYSVNFETIKIQDRDSYGRIYLYAEIDAQNSFGAMIRTNLRIVLQSVNEDGTYEALNEAVYPVSFINTEDVVKKVNKWNKPK